MLKSAPNGFTMLETMVTVSILGILSAVAIPSWWQFAANQRLSAASSRTIDVLRDAQTLATRSKRTAIACFHDDGSEVSFGTLVVSPTATNCGQVSNWQPLMGSADSKLIAISTTSNMSISSNPPGYYGIGFEVKGVDLTISSLPQSLIVVNRQNPATGSCLQVQTILGGVRILNNPSCS